MELQLSKLLGMPFGIDLSTHDVDDSLYSKICRKLIY